MRDIDITYILFWFLAFLFSLTIHECAHAWTSERFGDDTGRYQGRISLNPIAHIDPLGTIVFPLISLITGSAMFFGWAKPVPVDPNKWNDKTFANIAVSGAGPASNLLLATLCAITLKIMMVVGVLTPWTFYHMLLAIMRGKTATGEIGGMAEPLTCILCIALMINITLAVFNMLPIPPLDGSHILASLLGMFSPDLQEQYESLRPYGMFILLGCSMTGLLGMVTGPMFSVVFGGLFFLLSI
ncbi:MAG: site-2 protease family protein [Blastocatellia bacterium]|nr:site-2 protease family protein [Blastocatellia bacterium]